MHLSVVIVLVMVSKQVDLLRNVNSRPYCVCCVSTDVTVTLLTASLLLLLNYVFHVQWGTRWHSG
jgi:hypothetical protein